MEKYIKKHLFLKKDMIKNNGLKTDFYDIIVENMDIKMIADNEGGSFGKYGIETIVDESVTITYYYKERADRDSDFEQLEKFKKVYGDMGGN